MPGSELLFDDAAELARHIHSAGTRLVVALTGGGSLSISSLLTVPGGSRSVLEAIVPYSAGALTAFLGAQPEQFCSEPTARMMAIAAYERAARYAAVEASPTESAGNRVVAGIGCTASLASDRPKHGPHRLHVAAQTAEFTAVASLELTKDLRTRGQEEAIAARLVLNMIARACGIAARLPLDLQNTEHVVAAETIAPPSWRRLFVGEIKAASGNASRGLPESAAEDAALAVGSSRVRRLIFSGAFHPLHDGHRAMARVAAARCGMPVEWEISIENVDKPPIDYHEMRLRAEQFSSDAQLWFTRAPTFVEKSRIFPGATFLVGADTIMRIAEPRYYGDDASVCIRALETIAAAGCRFLVFGRKAGEHFETLSDLHLPAPLRAICDEVPADAFRVDMSSTELRKGTN